MSKLEEILITIRNILNDSEEFHGIDVYFDDSEMNPNITLPAISFKVGTTDISEPNPMCMELSRNIEIRLHTKTTDKRKLQSELYDYEEQLINVIQLARQSGSLDFEIIPTQFRGIGALFFNARKDAGQFNKTFFSNLLRMKFKIRYSL